MGPFNGLNALQRRKLYKLLQVHIYRYRKNQEILSTINNEKIIGIILTGKANIISTGYDGEEIVTEQLAEDDLFGTNLSGINYDNREIIATEDCEILVINYATFNKLENSNHTYFNIFLNNLYNIMNDRFKKLNEKIRILEKKTIRERLLEYFELQYKYTMQRTITLPFNLKDLADYLAINRSAMFRELRNLKDERIISVNGRRITLLLKNRTLLN